MYWICFGDSAKGSLAMARSTMEPALDVEHILALSDDYAQGDIRDVTDRAARSDIIVPWQDEPKKNDKWRAEQSPRAGMAYFSTAGEAAPNILPYFYQRRRQLTETEQAVLLTEWRRMQEQNTPLRAMVDGKVQSVPADFYDETILSCVPEEESQAALTVGRSIIALDKTGNRVSDMLVFSRIRALGAAGRLEVVRDGATYRDMTIRQIHA